MDLITVTFYFLAVVVLGSAAIVVFSKNIMYAAFSLLFTFFGVAGLYVLLNADFIAITQIMIYIGGILVLIIFGVMLTTKITGVDVKTGTMGSFKIGLAALACAVIAITLLVLYANVNWMTATALPQQNTIKPIGYELLTKYLLAFEVASVLLLIAIIGAALIARRK